MSIIWLSLLTCFAAASPTNAPRAYGGGIWSDVWSLVQPLLQGTDLSISGPFAPITPEILQAYIEPVNVRESPSELFQENANVCRNNCFATAT